MSINLDSAVERLFFRWRADFIEKYVFLPLTQWVNPSTLHGLPKNLSPAVVVIALGKGFGHYRRTMPRLPG